MGGGGSVWGVCVGVVVRACRLHNTSRSSVPLEGRQGGTEGGEGWGGCEGGCGWCLGGGQSMQTPHH